MRFEQTTCASSQLVGGKGSQLALLTSIQNKVLLHEDEQAALASSLLLGGKCYQLVLLTSIQNKVLLHEVSTGSLC